MPVPATRVVRGSIATLVGLTVVSIGMVWLFLGMRAVMDVGGYCASGGPYEIATPCPDGIALLVPAGILGGLVGLFIYQVFGLRAGPRPVLLLWPALFLSLGWNFLEYGLHPVEGNGMDASLLVVAVLFLAMGGLPLLILFNRAHLRAVFWTDPPDQDGPSLVRVESRRPEQPPEAAVGSADDLSVALEKLHQLHSRGALTAEEFTAAKRRLLE